MSWFLALVAAAGAVMAAVQLVLDPRALLHAWLAAFFFLLSLAVGSTLLVMIGHAARVGWFVALRRLAEIPMAATPLLLPALVPVLAGADLLYPWVGGTSARVPPGWLHLPFFCARVVAYVGVASAFAIPLASLSLRQDHGSPERARLLRFSVAGLVALPLAFTFAGFDLILSLQPDVVSTVFGLYLIAGALCAAMALVALAAARNLRAQRLPEGVGAPHLLATGKLMLAFTCTWAWMAFSQLIVIWSANLPHPAEFYLVRTERGWGPFTTFLVVARFAVPFFWLLSREVKRSPRSLAAVAGWMIAAQYLDVYWLVVPAGVDPGWSRLLDAGPLLLLGGVLGILVLDRARRVPLVARGDPGLPGALRYRGT